MRIAIDTTPAAVQSGGVGRYARELLVALVQETLDHQFILSVAADASAAEELLSTLPPGAWREVRRLPARERVMTAAWQRLRLPIAVDRWTGGHDLFHGLDYTLPPTTSPTVVTIHDLSFIHHPNYCHPKLASYLQQAVPRAIARADAIITVSASVAAEVAAAYPAARERIVAVPNGVKLAGHLERHEGGVEPIILMVGTIEPRKNHRTVLAAMDGVRARHPDARLVVVGRRGWLDDEIVADLRQSQAAGWLTWHENAGDAQLELAYRAASVFVAASHYEGFGLPVLEALSRGVPVVASDIAAHREVAGQSALMVDGDDVDSITYGICRVLDDATLRTDLSAQGIARAAAFSWTETARRTLRVYERVGGAGI